MLKRCLLVAALVVQLAVGLYEDQIGQYDWRQERLGNIQSALYEGRRVLVATESNVVASVSTRGGKTEWRLVLPKTDTVDKILQLKNSLFVLSGGGTAARMLTSASGGLLWNSAVPPTADALPGDAVLTPSQDVIALRSNVVQKLALASGDAAWSWDPESSDDTKGGSFSRLAADTKGGTVFAIGVSADGKKIIAAALDMTNGALKNAKSFSVDKVGAKQFAADAVLVAPEGSVGGTLAAVSTDGASVVLLELGSGSAEVVSVSALVSGATASALEPLAPPLHAAVVPALVLRLSGGGYAAARLGEGSKELSLLKEFGGEVSGVTGRYVFGTAADAGKQLLLAAVVTPSGAKMFFTDVATGEALTADGEASAVTLGANGAAAAAFPNVFTRKDGSTGVRVLLVGSDHSATMAQPGKTADKADHVLWQAEEGLAAVTDAAFVDKPLADSADSDATDIPGFAQRLQMQVADVAGAVDFFTGMFDGAGGARNGNEGVSSGNDHRFGLSKVAVLLSRAGKLFGLDASTGQMLWSVLLPFADLSQGAKYQLFVTRSKPVIGLVGPEVLVLATGAGEDGALEHTAVWVETMTGTVLAREELPADTMQVMLLPPGADAAPGARSTLLAAVGAAGAQPELLALPNTQATHSAFLKEQARFSFHLLHTPPEGAGGYQQLQGYTVLPGAAAAGRYQTLSKWSFVLGAGERVRAAAMTDAGEAVNSPVRILGDDSLLLKYLNSHTLAFAATSPGAAASEGAEKEAPQLAVYIVDTVTGKLVHHVTHKHGAGPVQLAQSENWVLYCYWNAKARRTEMGSMSLYEGSVDKYGLNPWTRPEQRESFSSHAAGTPIVLQRSFVFPVSVAHMTTTQTKQGIASRHVLLGLASGQLYSLDRRFLDPRRTSGKPSPADMQEGLMQYQPHLPLMPNAMVSYNQSVARMQGIATAPAALESTCAVLAYGLDLFYVRATPSKLFDVLAADFNHPLLILLISALAGGTVVTGRLVKAKRLREAWK